MPRYKLTIEYDGAPFAGWQLQPDHPRAAGFHRETARASFRFALTIYAFAPLALVSINCRVMTATGSP